VKIRSIIATALAPFAIAVAMPTAAHAEEACGPSETPPVAPETTQFFGDDKLLGPQDLPTEGPVARLLKNYSRFGPMTQADWERTFRTYSTDPNIGPWKWPPGVQGFDVKAGPPWGAPTEKKFTLFA
jgi:hypothetical protein